jgi:hypothetical protein
MDAINPVVAEEVVEEEVVEARVWGMTVAAVEEPVTVVDAPVEQRILIATKGAWQVSLLPSNGHVYLETIAQYDEAATQVYIGQLDQPVASLTETDIVRLGKTVFQTFLTVVNG